MLLTQYQKAMLSIVNESETKVFQQELLTIKIYPTLQQMGNEAAKEVADRICKLLEEKAEINIQSVFSQRVAIIAEARRGLAVEVD